MVVRKPSVFLQPRKLRISGTCPLKYQRLPAEIQGQFEDHLSKYTDGSKGQGQVASTEVYQWLIFGIYIPNQSLIFTEEAHAQAVAGLNPDHPFLEKVIYKMNHLATDRYDIHLC